MPIFQNVSLPSLDAHLAVRLPAPGGGIRAGPRLHRAARPARRRAQPGVGTLSGGNQQKVVIAKWLATQPKVIILDEPTKGIDIGSKAAVHAFMSELAGEGLSVIMVSSELPEILGMSDRVLVMREGRIGRHLRARRTSTPRRWCAPRQAMREGRMMIRQLLKYREMLLVVDHRRAARAVRHPLAGLCRAGNLANIFNDTVDPDHPGARPDGGDPDALHRPVDGRQPGPHRHGGRDAERGATRHSRCRS